MATRIRDRRSRKLTENRASLPRLLQIRKMETTSSKTALRKWLLRIFLGSFVLAIAAPVAVAVAVLRLSPDTRVLRNAAIHGDGAIWQRQVEVSAGALPFWLARFVLPFTPAPPEA